MKIINVLPENCLVVKISCWTVRVTAAQSLSPPTGLCLLNKQIKLRGLQAIKKLIWEFLSLSPTDELDVENKFQASKRQTVLNFTCKKLNDKRKHWCTG